MGTEIDRYFKDGHGHEIEGLKEAKTKEEKIAAIEKHMHMLEGLHSEIYNAVEQKLVDIKADKQIVCPMSKYSQKVSGLDYQEFRIDGVNKMKELTEGELRNGEQGFVMMDNTGKLIFKK